MLKGTQIDIDELQSQDNTKAEQELQQLKEQRDKQKKIYDEKKQANAETLNQMTQVEQQMNTYPLKNRIQAVLEPRNSYLPKG